MEQPRVGILAYGSLIDDLGPDLTPLKVGPPVKTTTPFCVEFARSSRSRDHAPTLVPVENGRRVAAVIHEVKTTIAYATNFLYWRERHLPQGSPQRRPYRQPNPVTVNSSSSNSGQTFTGSTLSSTRELARTFLPRQLTWLPSR